MSDSQTDDAPDGLTKEQLWKRVRRLEKHAFPDRRDLLKAGGALGAAGLLGGAGYGAGKAEAGAQSAGDVGTPNNPSDAYLEDVYPPGGSGSGNSTFIESISTEEASITNVASRAALTTNQTISTGTVTKVNLDQTEFEQSSVVSVDLTNSQLVIEQAGTYALHANVRWAGSTSWSSGDRLMLFLTENGTDSGVTQKHHSGVNEYLSIQVSSTISVPASATPLPIDMRVFQNSGGGQDLLAGTDRVYLSVGRLG